jgi:predicted dehydrogenase
MGVDCVFIAAGGGSNAATELAVRIARDRARVVDIGKTRLDLPWNDYYLKELDVRFSRSYGPGRYDPNYEERGIDYPIGYVRWTEKRNLASFIDLLSSGAVKVEPLITRVRPFGEAETVYQEMADGAGNVLSVVFEYEKASEPLRREAPRLKLVTKSTDKVRIGVIGAGAYASSMLLPPLKRNAHAALVSVASTTPLSGQNAKRHFGFDVATTDYREILQDPAIDAVIIATRHASHARLVAEALKSGKTIYVEKPLAITAADLALVKRAIDESGNERLMVGFNRRFSPMVRALAERFRRPGAPLVAHYRVHAGQLDKGSWYLDSSEGSRFAGEAGHFIDVLSHLVGAPPVSVMATRLKPASPTADDLDNVCALVRYADGSVASLQYLTQGALKVPKEYLEVFGGGITAQMHNFESLLVFEHDRQKKVSMRLDKGQQAEMDAFVHAVKHGAPMPIALESLLDTTALTLAIEESARSGTEVPLAEQRAA